MTATPHRAEPIPQPIEDLPIGAAQAEPDFDDGEWAVPEIEQRPRGAGGRAVLGWTLALLAALWIAYTAWSAGRELANQPLASPAMAQWVAVATGPLALLGLLWLIFGRTRRKEAEAFTRSVVNMRNEARSLEALLSVLSQRIDENHAALNGITDQLMGLGDEASSRLGAVTRDLEQGSQRLAAGESGDGRPAPGVDLASCSRTAAGGGRRRPAMAEALRSAGSGRLARQRPNSSRR
jgi:hypothetical protein